MVQSGAGGRAKGKRASKSCSFSNYNREKHLLSQQVKLLLFKKEKKGGFVCLFFLLLCCGQVSLTQTVWAFLEKSPAVSELSGLLWLQTCLDCFAMFKTWICVVSYRTSVVIEGKVQETRPPSWAKPSLIVSSQMSPSSEDPGIPQNFLRTECEIFTNISSIPIKVSSGSSWAWKRV